MSPQEDVVTQTNRHPHEGRLLVLEAAVLVAFDIVDEQPDGIRADVDGSKGISFHRIAFFGERGAGPGSGAPGPMPGNRPRGGSAGSPSARVVLPAKIVHFGQREPRAAVFRRRSTTFLGGPLEPSGHNSARPPVLAAACAATSGCKRAASAERRARGLQRRILPLGRRTHPRGRLRRRTPETEDAASKADRPRGRACPRVSQMIPRISRKHPIFAEICDVGILTEQTPVRE